MSLDYDHLLRLCLKYWMWLVGAVVLGLVVGYIYAAKQLAIYETYSTIVVNGEESSVPKVVGEMEGESPDVLKTLEQMLQTKDLPQRVVETEHLNENVAFLSPKWTQPVSEDEATSLLASDVSIRIRPLTRLIDITVDHPNPEMAKFLADKLAEQSIIQRSLLHQGGAGILSTYFQQEVDRLKEKVRISREALHDYEVAHKADGIVSDGGSQGDLTASNLQDLNGQYMKAVADETALEERYGENHPKLIQAKKLVEELHNEVMKAQDVSLGAGADSIVYDQLKTEAESYETQLSNMLKALNDANVAQDVANPGISVVGEADLPVVPKYPSKTKSAALGGFIGLVCGLAFVFAVYFIDGTIRTVSQAESTFALPVIAAVPILTEQDGKSVLPAYSDPQSFVAESFRGLRASLLLHDRENPLKTILVVSAVPGEGKSFCAANLAVAFAQAGLKTLLIDGDLRLPTLHTYFNVPGTEGVAGFANFLTGKQTLASAAIKSPIPTLDLLLTISPADSPAEMLSSIRLPILLDEVASKYDRVVLDSAPINAVSDTMLIMPKADAVLLVVRASSTPASETKAALQRIYSSKMKPLGLILNYLAPHTLKSYAYGYSYGQKPKEKNAK
jgi:capsular exopolysaccharide synthesis family protein